MIAIALPGPSNRTLAALLAIAAALATVAVALARMPGVALPELNLVLRPFGILVPAAIGSLWWRRRPTSRIGPLLIALGLLGFVPALQLTRDPWLAQLGLASEAPLAILQAFVVLTFPSGRLRSRADRVAMAPMLFGILLAVAVLPFIPELRPVDYLSACNNACPPNPVFPGSLAGEGSDLAQRIRIATVLVAGVLMNLPVLVLLVQRWQAANRRRRATLAPFAALSLPVFVARAVNQVALLALALPPSAFIDLTWLTVVGRIAFPLGFLAALLRAEFVAGRETAHLIQRLSADRDRASWAATIAEALDDRSVQVWFARDDAPERRGGRTWIDVGTEDGRPLAIVSAAASLADEPELQSAVAAATRVAAETGELLDDLRQSRARLVDAADQERRRLGRDLHDSAQQRLVAMRVRLALAHERLGAAAESAGLPELERELDGALEDLRAVARGLYPVLLSRDGLVPALRSATRSAATPVTIVDTGISRHPELVEAAVYFTCLEALQNVAKHGGPGTSATITIGEEDNTLTFTIRDDGCGFDTGTARDGTGLLSMRDRIAAVDGSLSIESTAGQGTTIRGRVPG